MLIISRYQKLFVNFAVNGLKIPVDMFYCLSLLQLVGVSSCGVPNQPNGTLSLIDLENAIRPLNDVHQPWTQLICLENTQNRCGGKVLNIDYMKQVRSDSLLSLAPCLPPSLLPLLTPSSPFLTHFCFVLFTAN